MTTSFEKLAKHANDIGINFVMAEIDLAVRLLENASATHDEVRKRGLRQEAGDAYDTVLRCIPHLHLTESQEKQVEELLGEVRSRLEETNSGPGLDKGKPGRQRNRPYSV
jgi:hypothetical protein